MVDAAADDGGAITARAVIEKIIATNVVFKWLGAELIEVDRGRSRVAMIVRSDMANVHGTLHGGLMFTLADIALGFAAQAYNERAVSAAASIDFIASGRIGERIVAESEELHREGRNAYIRVTITGEGGRVLALLHGRMRFIGGHHIEPA
jgi:acyl-CoA thioesterase